MVTFDADHKTGYIGRFAPSPTGPLHFGSLVAAVASHAAARAAGGVWQVRIEDIDPPREVPGAATAQLETLERFGMRPDGPVVLQSRSARRHAAALQRLKSCGRAFDCACSRAELPPSGVYPGTCRDGLPAGREARSVRLRIDPGTIEFSDRVFGAQSFDLARDCGDFVIRRADGLFAYQLAVVVDDAAGGITEVVRGADLLDSTPRQIALYRALGLAEPAWLHVPLVVDAAGRKLSKSAGDDPVDRLRPAAALRLVLEALGHAPPPGRRSLEALWTWVIAAWDPRRIPRQPFELAKPRASTIYSDHVS